MTSLIFPELNVRDSLRRLLRSLRWHLAGMSTVWLIVLLLNMDHSPVAPQNLARENIPSPQQLLASLRENRRLLLEMIGPPVNEPAAIPPRRSQLQFTMAIA